VRRGQHECQLQYPINLEIWKKNAISVFPRHDNMNLFNHLQNTTKWLMLPRISIDFLNWTPWMCWPSNTSEFLIIIYYPCLWLRKTSGFNGMPCTWIVFLSEWKNERWGCRVLSMIVSIDQEECGVRILQVSVNFACYYRIPKYWNPETYTRLQKNLLKYFSRFRQNWMKLNISWPHYSIGLKPTYVDSFDKGPLLYQ